MSVALGRPQVPRPPHGSKEWHACAAINCERRCQTRYLMCWVHWCCIPKVLKARIYETCAAGCGPTYTAAVDEAVAICVRRDARRAGLLVDDAA